MPAPIESLTATEALARAATFSSVIDARSEDEFELDCFPGAINCPVLTNEERARVGTIYKQQSPFEARKIGAALVARNIAHHLEERWTRMPRDWSPLIYCWRGGGRSGAMAHVLAQIGWRVGIIVGGYQAYRRQVIQNLAELPSSLRFVVICGSTGSGKSRLLNALQAALAQVLDLEALAQHRGSILGPDPQRAQPSQRAFESRLHATLSAFDASLPVFVECESTRIGSLRVPMELVNQIRQGQCVRVETSLEERVQLLMDEYRHWRESPDALIAQFARLANLHGNARVACWSALARSGDWTALVDTLLREHYDPAYARSTPKHFRQYESAIAIALSLREDAELKKAARSLIDAIGGLKPAGSLLSAG